MYPTVPSGSPFQQAAAASGRKGYGSILSRVLQQNKQKSYFSDLVSSLVQNRDAGNTVNTNPYTPNIPNVPGALGDPNSNPNAAPGGFPPQTTTTMDPNAPAPYNPKDRQQGQYYSGGHEYVDYTGNAPPGPVGRGPGFWTYNPLDDAWVNTWEQAPQGDPQGRKWLIKGET